MNGWFKALSDMVERLLFYSALGILIVITLVQFLMLHEDIRGVLSRVDILEGEPYFFPADLTEGNYSGAIIITTELPWGRFSWPENRQP